MVVVMVVVLLVVVVVLLISAPHTNQQTRQTKNRTVGGYPPSYEVDSDGSESYFDGLKLRTMGGGLTVMEEVVCRGGNLKGRVN